MPKQEALLVAVSCGIGTVVMSFLATRYFKQSKRAKKAKAFNRSVAQAQIESKEEVFVRGVVSSPEAFRPQLSEDNVIAARWQVSGRRSGFTVWTDRIAPHIYLAPEGESGAAPLLVVHKDDQSVSSMDVLPLVPRDDRGFWDRWAPFSAHLEEEVLPNNTQVTAIGNLDHSPAGELSIGSKGVVVTRRTAESYVSSRNTYGVVWSLAAVGTLGLGVWALLSDFEVQGQGGPGAKGGWGSAVSK